MRYSSILACLFPQHIGFKSSKACPIVPQTKNCKMPPNRTHATVSHLGTRRKLPTPLTTENQPATSATLFVRTHLDDGLSIDEATLKLVKELRTYLVTAQALHLPKDTLAGIVL